MNHSSAHFPPPHYLPKGRKRSKASELKALRLSWPLTRPYMEDMSAWATDWSVQRGEKAKTKKIQQLRIHWLISHAFHRLRLYVYITTGVLVFLHFTNSAFIVSFLGFISVILAHFNTAGMHVIATQVLMYFYLILLFEWPHFYTYPILLLNRPWALYPPMEITPFAIFVTILWITCFSKASTFH